MSDAHILQLLGLIYITFGLGAIINKTHYRNLMAEAPRNLLYMLLSGMLAFIIGFLIVRYHNTWTCTWSVLVTIIGWLSLIKGILIIVTPQTMIRLTQAIFNHTKNILIPALLILLLGILLALLGFCVLPCSSCSLPCC